MWRALATKEFREVGWIALVGLALGGASLVWSHREVPGLVQTFAEVKLPAPRPIPFLGWKDVALSLMLAGFIGVAIALRQTVGESLMRTDQFLGSLPIARSRIVLVKLLVGAVATWVTAIVPVMLYACWAATPGTHASPFEWRFVFPSIGYSLVTMVVYVCAFLVGLRSARWFGTRVLPGIGAAAVLCAGQKYLIDGSSSLTMPLLLLGVGLVVLGVASVTFALRAAISSRVATSGQGLSVAFLVGHGAWVSLIFVATTAIQWLEPVSKLTFASSTFVDFVA